MIPTELYSVFVGACAGTLYGLSFLLQGKAFFSSQRTPSMMTRLLIPLIRVTSITALLFYLLRSTPLQPILILLSFLVFFWINILVARASSHGRL